MRSATLLLPALLLLAACSNSVQDARTRGQVVGGATGAAVGSLFGEGSGKTAATAAGAIVGAVAGGEIAEERELRRRRR